MKLFFNRSFNLCHCRVARGFTLLELLVVVALLALLASVALVGFNRTTNDMKEDVVRIEMAEIRKALRMFYRDVGHFPDGDNSSGGLIAPENSLSPLLNCQNTDNTKVNTAQGVTYDVGCSAWDPDTKRGWNGPYMSSEGILDPWHCEPDGSGPCDETEVHLYHLFDPNANDATLDNTNPHARLVSLGPNGVYEGDNSGPNTGNDYCAKYDDTTTPGEDSDDIILCLLK